MVGIGANGYFLQEYKIFEPTTYLISNVRQLYPSVQFWVSCGVTCLDGNNYWYFLPSVNCTDLLSFWSVTFQGTSSQLQVHVLPLLNHQVPLQVQSFFCPSENLYWQWFYMKHSTSVIQIKFHSCTYTSILPRKNGAQTEMAWSAILPSASSVISRLQYFVWQSWFWILRWFWRTKFKEAKISYVTEVQRNILLHNRITPVPKYEYILQLFHCEAESI
jgi:hypothetical protein